ncbi:MAG: AI-2E family transporter, partial [Clostridia bacterium]|nr:AI-2E family transporter [Clostridia bacterium]
MIAVSLVGIFAVLTISNLDAILSPLGTLLDILAPITVGLVMAYILNFFLRFFEYKLFRRVKKRTVNRALSMVASYLFLLLILAGFLFLIIPSVIDSATDLEANGLTYISNLIDTVNNIIAKLPFVEPGNQDMFLDLEKLLTYVLNLLSSSGDWIISNLAAIAGSTITVLKNIVVGLFISVYVLLSKERLNAGCRRVFRALFSKKNEARLIGYFTRAHSKFGGYMIGKLVDSMLVMLVCMLLFSIFQIPYAILIAVIIGVTDIIPFFGPFLGAIPSGLIIFIADPWKAIVFALLILVVQQIDGNLIAPAILGDRTGLSSLGVIIAVTVMGGVFGVTGMLIGVPLFALFISILDDFITSRLKAKGEETNLDKYYPADAFIRPQDEERKNGTLTQRFVRWVCTVETEKKNEDYTPSWFHSLGRGFRRVMLAIGRGFKRLFSIKPIPQDRAGDTYETIARYGIPCQYNFWYTLILSVLTLGIYPLCMISVIAQSTNIACRKDGKRTWGGFAYFLFTICTLGVFAIAWHCRVINRMQQYLAKHDQKCLISKRYYLCWTLIGLPILVGPLIALARFLKAFCDMGELFNSTHVFPLCASELARDIPELVE